MLDAYTVHDYTHIKIIHVARLLRKVSFDERARAERRACIVVYVYACVFVLLNNEGYAFEKRLAVFVQRKTNWGVNETCTIGRR